MVLSRNRWSPRIFIGKDRMSTNKLLAKKIGMTSTIDADGQVKAVTLLSVLEHNIIGKKIDEKDGYNALRVGIGSVKKLPMSIAGQIKKIKVMPKYIREFRLFNSGEIEEYNVGDQINSDIFNIGDTVDVQGLSKGKGWAGTIKRHNFHRGRKTHGGRSYRRVGSIGSMYPQHILKGKKMSGRMGHEQVTIKNLKIAVIDAEKNLIGIYGAVPGPKKSLILIKGSNK